MKFATALLATGFAAVSMAGVSATADAKTETFWKDDRKQSCYEKHYVQATYKTDSMGELVEGPSTQTIKKGVAKGKHGKKGGTKNAWGEQIGSVIIRQHPATYKATTTLVEPGHYVLKKVACTEGHGW